MITDKYHLHLHTLGRTELNALYVTLSILAFAEGLIGVFVPIYFWNLGFPLWKILLFYLLHSALFLAFAFALLPMIKKLSDKMMMFLSIPFLILYFLGLGMMKAHPFLFFMLPIASALNGLLFNIGYNIDFSSATDRKELGKEVGTRYMLGSVLALAAPFFGGVLISATGFQTTFYVGSAILLVSVLPLFFFPNRNLSKNLTIRSIVPFFKEKELRPFTISGIGYAMETVVGRAIWPLFIFIVIGDFKEFGSIISLGLIVTATVTYLVGFLADYGKRRNVITWASIGNAFMWSIRPFVALSPMVVGVHIGGNVVNSGLMVAWTSQYYKITKTVSNATAFIISRELLYNATRVVFIPILMLIAYFVPTGTFFALSFVAAAFASMLFIVANETHSHLVTGRMTLEHVDDDQLA
jgi:MFS family permease